MLVKVFKLVSGEEVLGEVEGVSDVAVTIRNPVTMMLQRTAGGETGLGIAPFMPYIKNKVVQIPNDKIILDSEVDDMVINQYNSIFGGIVVPPKTLITG